MPLAKPYPPTEVDYQDWNDLVDNYAEKAVTIAARAPRISSLVAPGLAIALDELGTKRYS